MHKNNNILEVENLLMQFGGVIALKDINLNVPSKSITAIIGPNGAGKTTLFNCLTGFYKASSGTLLYQANDQTIPIAKLLGESFKLKKLINPIDALSCIYYKMFGGSHLVNRLGIARTFQNIRLFKEMTVVENLLVAQHSGANRNLLKGIFNTKSFRAWEQSALAKAFDFLDQFDLSDDANRLAGELPYGKQRHLEIARAMCTKPKLLCLDEPAAGLNPQETIHLSLLIKQLQVEHEVTVLLIEHDMSMVMEISDKVIVLDHGEVIASDTPDNIQNNPEVIRAYLGIEQETPSSKDKDELKYGNHS